MTATPAGTDGTNMEFFTVARGALPASLANVKVYVEGVDSGSAVEVGAALAVAPSPDVSRYGIIPFYGVYRFATKLGQSQCT